MDLEIKTAIYELERNCKQIQKKRKQILKTFKQIQEYKGPLSDFETEHSKIIDQIAKNNIFIQKMINSNEEMEERLKLLRLL
jgi:septal ring factor EnvC (AmiA/AmiB activator)